MPAISAETLLRYCETVYDELEKSAKKDGDYALVWEGKVVATYANLGLSNSHYARIFSTLQEIGCIEQLQRGAKGTPTRYALYQKPELAMLEGSGQGRTSGLTNPSPHDKLSQRVNVLERRLQGIDLAQYIVAQEAKYKKLELRLKKVEAGKGK